MAQNNTVQIKHVIQTLSQEFALSQHPHSRKGGLIGLAACSIALGKVGLSPEAVALTFTAQPQQAAADLCFTAVLTTAETSTAGFAALRPCPEAWALARGPTCFRPALTQRPEPLQGSRDVRWDGWLGAHGLARLEWSLLLPRCRTRGCT